MHINEQPDTYPENLRALAPTVLAGEATRKKKKKSKIAASADAFPFGGTTFGGFVTSIASKGKYFLHRLQLGFFRHMNASRCLHPFIKLLRDKGTIDKFHASFYLKPS